MSVNFTSNRDFYRAHSQFERQQVADWQSESYDIHKDIIRANQQAATQGRQNAALPEDAWVDMDDTTTQVVRDELRLVTDLRSSVGTHAVPIDAKLDTWHIAKTGGEGQLGMTPDVATDESVVGFDDDGTPVPIAYDGYSIDFRDAPVDGSGMDASLDTLHQMNSARLVSEVIEQVFVDASGFDINVTDSTQGYDLYGMTDHPSTATGSTQADWTTDNSIIRDDFRAARSVLKNDRNYSSGYAVYLGNEYYDELDSADPEGDGNLTIRDRVEDLSGIQWVRELDSLPDKSMLMFKPSPDVLQVGQAASIQPVQQEEMFSTNFVMMGAMYPRIYQQYNVETESLQNGILYWTAP